LQSNLIAITICEEVITCNVEVSIDKIPSKFMFDENLIFLKFNLMSN